MDENKFLEKMRLLKLQETIRIVESKVGLQADKREWEQALSENKVSNVKYMGKTEIDGKWQDIYMVVEPVSYTHLDVYKRQVLISSGRMF